MLLTPRQTRIATIASLAIPLLAYGVLAAICCHAYRDRFNIDLTAYLRQAIYLARGDFKSSVSGYWSPLLSWSIAPFVGAGFDALRTSKFVHAAWGAIYLFAVWHWMGRLASVSLPWRAAAMCVLAVTTAKSVVLMVTPDLMLCALLFGYFAITLREDFLTRQRWAVAAGAIGGVAYLAKSYAMPFFFVHFPVACLLARWRLIDVYQPDETPVFAPRPARTFAVGMLGWLVVVTPWVVVLSMKYEKFTVNTVGGIAHAIIGPNVPFARHQPIYFGAAPSPYFSRNEVVDAYDYTYWSPGSSIDHFKHQSALVADNLRAVAVSLWKLDVLHFAPIILGIASVVCLRRIARQGNAAIVWLLFTVCLYVGGFMPVFFAERYTNPIVLPITLALAGILVCEFSSRIQGRHEQIIVRWTVLTAIAISFLVRANTDLQRFVRYAPQRQFREAAAELKSLKAEGPVASTVYPWGLFVAFHADTPYVGFPQTADPAAAEQMLEDVGARTLLVWDMRRADEMDEYDRKWSDVARTVITSPKWAKVGTINAQRNQSADVYVRAN